jgi:integrase
MEPADLARIVASAVTAALSNHQRPSVLPSEPAPPPDFHALARDWLAETPHRPSWRREIDRLLARDLAALTHPSRDDIGTLLRLIRPPSTHNHCLAIVGAVYRWGLATGRCHANPAAGFKRRPIAPRSRVLDLAEIARIWRASGDDDFGRITKALILTGARASEIGGLAWSEIGADRITLPPERVKNHRPHMIPLAAPLSSVLPARRPGYPYLFGRTRRCGFKGWGKAKADLDKRVKLGAPWVIHDIRRSAATHWAEQRLADADLVEMMLGHVRPGVMGTYNRAPRWEERTELAKRWADVVARL